MAGTEDDLGLLCTGLGEQSGKMMPASTTTGGALTLGAMCWRQHITFIITFNYPRPMWQLILPAPLLQVQQLRHREVK